MAYLFQSIDWSVYDEHAGDDPELAIPHMFEWLLSNNESDRRGAHAGLVQWPTEIVKHVGRLGALPQAIDCLIDLVANHNPPDSSLVVSLIDAYVDVPGVYVFQKRYFAGSRRDLCDAIVATFKTGQAVYFDCLAQGDRQTRAAAANLIKRLSGKDTEELLDQRLKAESDPLVLSAILGAVAELRPHGVTESVEHHIKSEDWDVTTHAWKALAALEQPMPNRGLWTLAERTFRQATAPSTGDPNNLVDLKALRAIRELGERAIELAILEWLDGIERTSLDSMHQYWELVISGVLSSCLDFWTPGAPLPRIPHYLMSAFVACDRYWANDNALSVERRERWLQPPLGLTGVAREDLRQQLGLGPI